MNERKCAVIGCGYVGATAAYRLTKSRLFTEMVLIDIDRAKAEGEAADLSHCLPFGTPMEIYAGDYSNIRDCALIILAAGAGQRPGQTRLDLMEQNVRIYRSIVSEIVRYGTEGILLVVTNPVDVLTKITLELSGLPQNRVIGTGTVLDTARLKYLIGKEYDVDVRNVHAFIIGEHGDSELPVFSSANVSGIDMEDFCAAHGKEQSSYSVNRLYDIFDEVKKSAYSIIEGKGATYYAIAESIARIASAILLDEKTVLPVSTLIHDYYGENEICIGVPAIVGRSGVEKILKIPLSESEISRFHHSASVIRSALDSLTATI